MIRQAHPAAANITVDRSGAIPLNPLNGRLFARHWTPMRQHDRRARLFETIHPSGPVSSIRAPVGSCSGYGFHLSVRSRSRSACKAPGLSVIPPFRQFTFIPGGTSISLPGTDRSSQGYNASNMKFRHQCYHWIWISVCPINGEISTHRCRCDFFPVAQQFAQRGEGLPRPLLLG